MAAPTLRDAIGIAVSIASGGAASPMLALALNMVDDLAFTAIDVAMGNMTWDEGLFSIAQAGVGSVVGATIGDAFSVAKAGITNTVGGVVAKTALTGMEMVTSNLTVGAINAFEYSSEGGFGFNANRYKEGLIGTSALASYAGGMAGTFAQGMLDVAFLGNEIKDETGKIKGYENVGGWKVGEDTKIANIQTLTGTIGNIVNAGVEFGISGHTTVNILNFRDIAKTFGWDWFKGGRENIFTGEASGGWRSVGLFQLSIDSERGISSRIGMGGIDLSLGNIVDSFKGISALNLNAQIVEESKKNLGYGIEEKEKAAAMRAALDFGKAKDKELIMNVLAGKDRLFMMKNVDGDGFGQTIENVDGGRDVFVKGTGSSNIIDWISGAITLSHEAQRTGKVELENQNETDVAIDSHMDIADKLEAYYGTTIINSKEFIKYDRLFKELGPEAFAKYKKEVYDSSTDALNQDEIALLNNLKTEYIKASSELHEGERKINRYDVENQYAKDSLLEQLTIDKLRIGDALHGFLKAHSGDDDIQPVLKELIRNKFGKLTQYDDPSYEYKLGKPSVVIEEWDPHGVKISPLGQIFRNGKPTDLFVKYYDYALDETDFFGRFAKTAGVDVVNDSYGFDIAEYIYNNNEADVMEDVEGAEKIIGVQEGKRTEEFKRVLEHEEDGYFWTEEFTEEVEMEFSKKIKTGIYKGLPQGEIARSAADAAQIIGDMTIHYANASSLDRVRVNTTVKSGTKYFSVYGPVHRYRQDLYGAYETYITFDYFTMDDLLWEYTNFTIDLLFDKIAGY